MYRNRAFAQINDWLLVGNRDACGITGATVCVHIYRSDKPGNDCKKCPHSFDLYMNYRDGDEVPASDLKNLSVVIASLRQSRQPTLVHCHAGMCRSPTIAGYLLAMVDDTTHPLGAFQLVEMEIYRQQEDPPKVCNIVHQPKKQLLRIIEQSRGKN